MCFREKRKKYIRNSKSWENDQDAQMEIITMFPDGDTWQRDSCNPFSQVMKVEASFRQCVLNPPNIPNHYPISALVHVSVLGDVFPAERSWQTGSSVQPEDLRRLRCLSGSGCSQQLQRCLESDGELTENGEEARNRRPKEILMLWWK